MNNEKNKPKAKIKVGVIGLGIMGSSISSNLQKSGFDVHGVDLHAPTRKKMKPLLSDVHADPSVLLQHSLKIISSLPSSKALLHVCHALCESKRALKIKGTPVLMETSTLTLQDKMAARDILLAGGIHMIDAPLSGTGAQAKTKDLSITPVAMLDRMASNCCVRWRGLNWFSRKSAVI